ncbi:MAG TPA: alpha/beta fold hydrolase [Solirubrobacteraceae bacterium]
MTVAIGAPSETRFELSDVTLTALTWGPQDGPPLLLLHGYPDTAWTWRHLGPELGALGWRAVAPFMRGYGPSGFASDGCYQVGALAKDVLELADALDRDRPAVLIGHDWGAIAASAAAAAAPARIESLVTLAVPPIGPLLFSSWPLRNWRTMARQLRQSWYVFFQQLPIVSERALDRVIPKLWRDWSPGYDATFDLGQFWTSLDTPARRSAALRYYRALLNPLYMRPRHFARQRGWSQRPRVRWLGLHGANDGCLRSEIGEAAGMDVVSGVGHFLHLEAPAEVNARVVAFVGAA